MHEEVGFYTTRVFKSLSNYRFKSMIDKTGRKVKSYRNEIKIVSV
jgi:hypothetical protein